MRSFIAIPVPDAIAEHLERLQRRIGLGRPVPRCNLHLTLTFLDDRPEEVLEDLHHELLAVRGAPFSVPMGGIGTFGPALFVEVAADPNLSRLHDMVASACRRAGITMQKRRFRPHVTVARLRPGATPPPLPTGLAQTDLPDLPVAGFALYASTLHPKGARHEVLAEYPFSP
ncbi:RNA 2',3'-cyclic phosphodiesterase [Ruegeria marina]|uniref:RNA 2',3'-cyclic phosphodiesterase n=1 Tax=Ruegeria marina TaxID=639004 RepID=A0A1G7C311_9RHOB|nr:RNA 2',3'-cyclic phosphodiesterase [Ruegeria marina]SDE33697.1 2'-5' RNA ligase [Ruegeria marina]